MKAALINNGIIENIIEVEDLSVLPGLIEFKDNMVLGKPVNFVHKIYDNLNIDGIKSDTLLRVKTLLDGVAKEHGYDDINTACSYVGIPNKYQVESMSFVQWRADVWSKYYQIIESGNFSTVEDIMNQLPGFYMIQVF